MSGSGEYISREAAIIEIQRHGVGCFDPDEFTPEQAERFVISRLKSIPAADVRPVVRAAWQSWKQDKPPCKWYSCDYCGFHALSKSNYCPNCGADMREES